MGVTVAAVGFPRQAPPLRQLDDPKPKPKAKAKVSKRKKS